MSKLIDMTGCTIGYLKVIERYPNNKEQKATWRCECTACGNKNVIMTGKQLRKPSKLKSCGCLHGKARDITGMKFGKLTAIKRVGTADNYRSIWLCQCECGKTKEVIISYLFSGKTSSCGCEQNKKGMENHRAKHLLSGTRLYNIWNGMKMRCYNTNNTYYTDYGGRGITVCDEWKNDFKTFYDWAMENGYNENAKIGECTIDRINNDLGYSPSNCRWVSMGVQAINKRKTIMVTIDGVTKPLAIWCEEYGESRNKIYQRYYKLRKDNKIITKENLFW